MPRSSQSANNPRNTTVKEKIRRLFRRGLSWCRRSRRRTAVITDITREPSFMTYEGETPESILCNSSGDCKSSIKRMNDRMYNMIMKATVIDSKLNYYKTLLDHKEKVLSDTYEKDSVLDVPELHCFLCHELFIKPVKTQCGHIFCDWCIKDYVETSACLNCPLCDTDITELIPSVHSESLVKDIIQVASEKAKQLHNITAYKRAFLEEKINHDIARYSAPRTNGFELEWF